MSDEEKIQEARDEVKREIADLAFNGPGTNPEKLMEAIDKLIAARVGSLSSNMLGRWANSGR